ncbi:MAG: glucose-6-phosphate dehydrogenase assembly protein OpcA [Candidatus Limnocylindrus sp.]|jgi:glucose-6-phosphate dehydrogenase assembly protein OpcA
MSLNSILASSLRWSSRATTVAEADALLAKLWASSEARRFLVSDSPTDATAAAPIAVRTGVMNLAVVANGEERAAHAASILATLPRNPSRTLFIVPRDPEGPATFAARLEVFCAVTPRGDGTSACTELLWIDVGGPAAHHLASIVPPLSLHDLPTLLWWDAPINASESDVRQLLRGVDRVIIDGATQPSDGLAIVRALFAAAEGAGVAVTDFALLRQGRWRDAIATMFDEESAAPFLTAITTISIDYSAGKGSSASVNVVRPAYHVAWLASRLNATVQTPLQVDEGDGWRAELRDASRHAIAVELRPVDSVLGAGTTIAVRIAADRRGDHFDLEVRADSTSTRAIAKVNGAVVHERTFQAPRWTEAALLSESLEFGEIDPLSPAIIRTMSALIG